MPITSPPQGTARSTLGATVEVSEVESLTKGVLIVGDGSGAPAQLSVGANDTVLTADSAEASGTKWAVAAGGGDITVKTQGLHILNGATGTTLDTDFLDVNFTASELTANAVITFFVTVENTNTTGSRQAQVRFDLEATTSNPTGTLKASAQPNQDGYFICTLRQDATDTSLVNVCFMGHDATTATIIGLFTLDSGDTPLFTSDFTIRMNTNWQDGTGNGPTNFRYVVTVAEP